jgi:hypothetical protein
LVDLVVDEGAPRRLVSDTHDRDGRILKALVNESLDCGVPFLLRLFPDGCVLETWAAEPVTLGIFRI